MRFAAGCGLIGSRGFPESLSAGDLHRGSVYALHVLDLLGDILDVIDGVLGDQSAGQHDDALRRGHTDVDVLADAVGSELGFQLGGDSAVRAGGSLLVAPSWASVAVRLAADGIVSSSTLFTPSAFWRDARPRISCVSWRGATVRSVVSALGASAGCRYQRPWARRQRNWQCRRFWRRRYPWERSRQGHPGSEQRRQGLGDLSDRGRVVERSANVTAMTPTTTAMPLATMIFRDDSGFMFGYSVSLASEGFCGPTGGRCG